MYVDLVECRSDRVRVEVNLARRGVRHVTMPAIVRIPVRVSAPAVVPEDEQISAFFETPAEDTAETALEELDEMLPAAEETEPVDAQQLENDVESALQKLDDMTQRTDAIRGSFNDMYEEAMSELSGSTEEDTEQLSSTIQSCLDAVDSLHQQSTVSDAEEAEAYFDEDSEIPAGLSDGSAYMRFFDRDESGEKVEVSSGAAAGQEVVCFDSTSGKLSRVCGIIKNDGEKKTPADDEDE